MFNHELRFAPYGPGLRLSRCLGRGEFLLLLLVYYRPTFRSLPRLIILYLPCAKVAININHATPARYVCVYSEYPYVNTFPSLELYKLNYANTQNAKTEQFKVRGII